MLTTGSKLSKQAVVWAYTLCDTGLLDILVLQVQKFALASVRAWLHCDIVATKLCLNHFIPAYIRELSMRGIHQSSGSNLIWCAPAKALPSPWALFGLRPHKTLKKSDLKNNLISQPKLITHGLLTVDASKSREWGTGKCCWWVVLDDHA